jgi:hypothetical protein
VWCQPCAECTRMRQTMARQLQELLEQRHTAAEALLREARKMPRCDFCGGELTYCDEGMSRGPSLGCLVCQLRDKLATAEALWVAAVEAEGSGWGDEITAAAKEVYSE